jgi:hypothetical protein
MESPPDCVHVSQPVQLESQLGLQQVQIFWVGQMIDRYIDSLLCRRKLGEISRKERPLIEAICISDGPRGIDRGSKCLGACLGYSRFDSVEIALIIRLPIRGLVGA